MDEMSRAELVNLVEGVHTINIGEKDRIWTDLVVTDDGGAVTTVRDEDDVQDELQFTEEIVDTENIFQFTQ